MNMVDRDLAVAAAARAFGAVGGRVVYVDTLVRNPGPVSVGDESRVVRAPSLLAFCDHDPGAAWPHPVAYALVDLRTGEASVVPSDRPPVSGRLPETWVVAADPDRLADLVSAS